MENSVMELVEMLCQIMTEAWGMPLGADKCVVERDRVMDILDEIKAQLPAEIEESKRLMAAKNEYISSAKNEADSIRKVAEEQARKMVDEQEITRTAKTKAQEMVEDARQKSAELRKVANDYAAECRRRTEDAIGTALEEIRQSRASFRSAANMQSQRVSLTPDEDDEEFL